MPVFFPKKLALDPTSNKILIVRHGGLGDVIMHRMLFKDIKEKGFEVHFSCPAYFHDVVKDHPYLDQVLYNGSIYGSYKSIYYTTSVCLKYEMKHGCTKHRSDIWADHLGINLTSHKTHLTTEKYDFKSEKPIVVLCPKSAEEQRDMPPEVALKVAKELETWGLRVIVVHFAPVIDWETIFGLTVKQYLSVINSADYIVSVDTAALHVALNKPTVGVFTRTDGNVVGKYHEKLVVAKCDISDILDGCKEMLTTAKF